MKKKIIFRDYLKYIGNKYDIYFTFEGNDVDQMDALIQPIDAPKSFSSLENTLLHIKEIIPTFSVLEEQVQGKTVFHLVQLKLSTVENYPLDIRVDKFKFGGKPAEIIEELGKTIPLFPQLGGTIAGNPNASYNEQYYDVTSHVVLNVSGLKVREILTRSVKLDNYKRLIWVSFIGKNGKCIIQFMGPAPL